MTQSINLMPKNYRQKLGDHRVRRRYLIHTSAALLLVGALGVQQQYLLSARARTETVQLERVNQLRNAQAKCNEIQRLVDQGTQVLAAYERTALPIELSRVIGTISTLFPTAVSVDTMRLWIQETQVARSAIERLQSRAQRTKNRKTKPNEVLRVLYCEFTGKAENSIEISNLLQNLETHPLFTNIQLDYSKATIINEHEAREFRVICEINLQYRYRPISEKPAPESDA